MSDKHASNANKDFNKLIQFRQAAYHLLGNARDSLFELTDAVIQLSHLQSFVELSTAPAFRRKWSSAYEALQDARPNRLGLAQLYLQQINLEQRLILLGDHTAWPRLWANTLEERSYQHQPSPIPGRRPVTIGLGYSTITVALDPHGSWALPLLHERIPDQKPILKAAQQLRQICQWLPQSPLSIWDSEYSSASFLKATADIPADKLIRLRSNLCLEGPVKAYRGRGPHPKHGIKFNFKDESTWWEPNQVEEYQDPHFGPLRVQMWKGLRFSKALDCCMWVAQVERLQGPDTRRKPKILWFAWVGEAPIDRWWSLYSRRFAVDHWYRFAKGRLYWTLPQVSSLGQADRWSDMMPLLTWELWLAREKVEDSPLPWQKRQVQLSPGRVCQGLQNILVAIGTPTRVCKPRGKSPGWPPGRVRTPRQRHEVLRSLRWKQIKARQKAKKAAEKPKRGRPKSSVTAIVA